MILHTAIRPWYFHQAQTEYKRGQAGYCLYPDHPVQRPQQQQARSQTGDTGGSGLNGNQAAQRLACAGPAALTGFLQIHFGIVKQGEISP